MKWAKTHTCECCKWSCDNSENQYYTHLNFDVYLSHPQYVCLWNDCPIDLDDVCRFWEKDEV